MYGPTYTEPWLSRPQDQAEVEGLKLPAKGCRQYTSIRTRLSASIRTRGRRLMTLTRGLASQRRIWLSRQGAAPASDTSSGTKATRVSLDLLFSFPLAFPDETCTMVIVCIITTDTDADILPADTASCRRADRTPRATTAVVSVRRGASRSVKKPPQKPTSSRVWPPLQGLHNWWLANRHACPSCRD
jgi:hypothetical protein